MKTTGQKTRLFASIILLSCLVCISCKQSQVDNQDEKSKDDKGAERQRVELEFKDYIPFDSGVALVKPGEIEAEMGTGDLRTLFDRSKTSWPDDIPASIPRFNFGKIDGTITSTVNGKKTLTLLFSNLQKGYVQKFNSLLQGRGHKTYLMTRSDSLIFSGQGGDCQVALSGNPQTAKLSVTTPDPGGQSGKTMELSLQPSRTFVGGSVTLSGVTVEHEGNKTIRAVFYSPDGKTATVTTRLNAEGEFELTWGPLETVGIWFVNVTGPLSSLVGEEIVLSFEVYPPAFVASINIEDFSSSVEQMEAFVQVTRQEIDLFTVEVPDKDEARETADNLLDAISSVDNVLTDLSVEFQNMYEAMLPLKPFPEFQENLASLATNLEPSLNSIRNRSRELKLTHEAANRAGDWCRTWHAQKEGLKILIDMTKVLAGGLASVKSWAQKQMKSSIENLRNKLLAENAQAILGLTDQQISDGFDALSDINNINNRITQLLDFEGSLGGWLGEIQSNSTNWLIDWIATKVAPNCRMYDADVSGKLVVKYYAKGMNYMVASYKWGGKIELFFEKRKSPDEIVKLKGQLWGNFGWRVGMFSPQLLAMDIPGVTGVGICIPRPPFVDFRDFFISLEGTGGDYELELELKSVEYDKPRLSYGFISVLWSPYQMVPAIDFPTMDVPGGEWFFTRVTELSDPDVDFFYIPLKVEEDRVILEHTFSRTLDYIEEAEFEATLTMKIEGKEGSIGGP